MPTLPGYMPAVGAGQGGGGSGLGGGGIPAAFVAQKGLSNNDLRDHKWKGLLIGLERAEAGSDWALAKQPRTPVDPIQATVQFNSGGNNPSTITITMPAFRDNSALGALGNGWRVTIGAGAMTSVRGNVATRAWEVTSTTTNTYGQMATAMANAIGSANVVLAGPGTQRFGNSGGLTFAGGQDAAEISATVDDTSTPPKVTIIYDNNDEQGDICTALDGLVVDEDTTLRCTLIAGSTAAASPEGTNTGERPFDLYYSDGSLPPPAELTGDWTADRLRLTLGDEDPIDLPTPDGIGEDAIQMVVSMSPGSLNKSNPPINIHLTVITPPNAFPTATTLNFQMGPQASGSIAYDPAVSVHNHQSTLSSFAREDIESSLVGQFYVLEVTLRDGRNEVVHQVNRNIEVVEEAPLDPKILVGTLQWDVTPASIAGVTADDLEGTYRAQFDTPYFPLTAYYFEAFIQGASGTAQSIRDRAQWVQVTHLDLAIDSTEAAQIARDIFAAGDDHFDIELRFFVDSTTLGAAAVTSRRIRIGATGGSGVDAVARAAAAAAQATADAATTPAEAAALVNTGIENGVQVPARAAPGNEISGVQQYFGADFYAPDATNGEVLHAHRNGSTYWGPAGSAPDLPPFADIRLLPGALPGSQPPDDFYVELVDKLTEREIDGLTLTIQGQSVTPHSSTPLSGFDTENEALIRFDISSVADTIANGISATTRSLAVDLTFGFTEGDDYRRRIILPVNNPNAPRLVQGELDTVTFNAATALDWLAPDMRSITLTAAVTFTFSNIQVGRPLVLEVIQDATGGKGITWPSSVEWAGGSAQGPSAAGNAVDIFTLLPLSSTRVLAAALLNVS